MVEDDAEGIKSALDLSDEWADSNEQDPKASAPKNLGQGLGASPIAASATE